MFVARDLRHHRSVAIKVMRPEVAAFLGADRFLHEIETVARLQHPHILPLYDSGDADGLLYFVMPHVEGESLRDRLEREKQLPVADAVAVARDVASALSFAHAAGVIHRDIKPENILLFGGSAVVADFGIARALRAAGQGRMTEAGLALGTPLYMSPEQASASGDIDARTDIYSLGCVVYEMLTGGPPFSGMSATDVVVRHLNDPPRPVRELRSSVPPPLALAIGKALQKLPADRYATAAEFSEALRAAAEQTGGRVIDGNGIRGKVAAAALLLLTGIAVTLYAMRGPGGEPPVENRYLVLPLRDQGEGLPGASGDQVAFLLRQTLGRWRDASVVSAIQSNDVWGGGSAIQSLEDAVRAARRVRAEYLLWGQQSRSGDSVRVDLALYRTRDRGRAVREASATLPTDVASFAQHIAGLVRSLVADSVNVRLGGSPLGTTSLAAWQSYAAGHSALTEWRFDEAVSQFDRAVSIDAEFAYAQYWAAQLRSWANAPEDWIQGARTAVAHKARLDTWRDSAAVDALFAMAEQRFLDACRGYRDIIARDSVDVVAWFGLGECQRRDRTVVRDTRSPSGWSFRSSLHGAITAYHRAFDLAPAAAFLFGDLAFERMRWVYFVEAGAMRFGQPEPPDTGYFGAFASLDADTIALIPHRYPDVLSMPRPASEIEALDRNRGRLRALAERWAADYPRSAQTHGSLARILELTGELGTDSVPGRGTALAEYRTARALTEHAASRIIYGADEVRVLIKSGNMAAARRLADSLLVGADTAPQPAAQALSGLAALRGRAEQAAELLVRSTSDSSYPFSPSAELYAPPLKRLALRLATYAAYGVPEESLVAQVAEGQRLLARHVPPARRASTWHDLMYLPLLFAFPTVRSPPIYGPGTSSAYSRIQNAIAARRFADARSMLAAERAGHRYERPGESAVSTVLLDTRLNLLAGDSAEALRGLTEVLNDLSVAPTLLIDEPVQAASLVRAFALASDLAHARGDAQAARRWASVVQEFWADADPALRAVAARLSGR